MPVTPKAVSEPSADRDWSPVGSREFANLIVMRIVLIICDVILAAERTKALVAELRARFP